jgi:predicted nuclease of restriction endonuclease-like RecB superfamily
MNTIQAKQVVYDGINFRSKLEARWYFFMKNLGWNIEYEPHMENIVGWIPDFLILGDGTKILVEVKPFQTFSDFNSDYALQTIEKIKNSLQNIKIDAILLVGSSLNLKPASCGGEF